MDAGMTDDDKRTQRGFYRADVSAPAASAASPRRHRFTAAMPRRMAPATPAIRLKVDLGCIGGLLRGFSLGPADRCGRFREKPMDVLWG